MPRSDGLGERQAMETVRTVNTFMSSQGKGGILRRIALNGYFQPLTRVVARRTLARCRNPCVVRRLSRDAGDVKKQLGLPPAHRKGECHVTQD